MRTASRRSRCHSKPGRPSPRSARGTNHRRFRREVRERYQILAAIRCWNRISAASSNLALQFRQLAFDLHRVGESVERMIILETHP